MMAVAMTAATPVRAAAPDEMYITQPDTWAALCTQWLDAVSQSNPQADSLRQTLTTAMDMVHRSYGLGARQQFLSICQMVADHPNGYWAERGRLALRARQERMLAAQP